MSNHSTMVFFMFIVLYSLSNVLGVPACITLLTSGTFTPIPNASVANSNFRVLAGSMKSLTMFSFN